VLWGYLRTGLEAYAEQKKIIQNDMNKRKKTAATTMIALLNLSKPVKCLFSQMISVGSAAS
jgi:accessory gene regulator protein AgrB